MYAFFCIATFRPHSEEALREEHQNRTVWVVVVGFCSADVMRQVAMLYVVRLRLYYKFDGIECVCVHLHVKYRLSEARSRELVMNVCCNASRWGVGWMFTQSYDIHRFIHSCVMIAVVCMNITYCASRYTVSLTDLCGCFRCGVVRLCVSVHVLICTIIIEPFSYRSFFARIFVCIIYVHIISNHSFYYAGHRTFRLDY